MENHVMNTYSRYDLVFVKGEGPWLTDDKGEDYLDFVSGIAVNCLGHAAPEIVKTINEQASKLIHISNLYWSEPQIELAGRLAEASGLDKVFFGNSGTEANETALKIARKYGKVKGGDTKTKIICMVDSFHGRSMGALSVTGQEKYRKAFRPLIGDVYEAHFNDLASVEALMDDDVCAVILEPVQGESGILPAEQSFMEGVRALCDKHDALLIFDEVQCGMGRTGSYFAWQGYGVKPDVMSSAKALGCGVPVGAFVLGEKVAETSLEPGDHGTTYGGNPFVCAAVSKVFDIFEEDHILDHVKDLTPYLEQKLDELVEKYEVLSARRGKGFIQGLVVKDVPVGTVVKKALAEGLLVISAGSDVLRMVPPLVITKEHIDEMVEKLEKALA